MKSMRLAIVMLAVFALAGSAGASEDATVGNFVQRLAHAKGIEATDALIALDSLRGVGIQLPADLDLPARLTEGDVARIARSIGLDVSTNRPDALFSNDQVDRFFEALQVEIALGSESQAGNRVRGGGTGQPFDPYAKGKGGRKGKKKGRGSIPAEPE